MHAHLPHSTSHSYQSHDGSTLLSEVATVQCILLPRALLVAGFSAEGEVLIIHFCNYGADHPEWSAAFFEHQFINETLLGVPMQVKALFAGTLHGMLIPDALYSYEEGRKWLQAIHHIHHHDWMQEYSGAADGVRYVFAIPDAIHRLLQRYFGHTSLLPLAAYQLYKPQTGKACVMQCVITSDLVTATLRSKGKLLWHQVFPYAQVTDIAWHFAHLCKEQHIPPIDLHIECTILCATCFDQILELETYFPKISWTSHGGGTGGPWEPAVFLLQQLYACALLEAA